MLYVTPTNRQLLALRTSSVARPWDPPTQVALVQVGYDGIFHVNHLASYWGTQNKMETPTVYLYGFHQKRWTNDEPRMNQWWTHWIKCFKAASFIVRTLFIQDFPKLAHLVLKTSGSNHFPPNPPHRPTFEGYPPPELSKLLRWRRNKLNKSAHAKHLNIHEA